jgi:hypothetical protein
MALPIANKIGTLEPWQSPATVLSRFSAEPAFSAAVSFGIFVCATFAFGLHQGIRTAVTRYSLLMIPNFRSIKADVHDERSVADALADAYGAVNAVSLYGVKRLIHVSGIGADPRWQSLYIRKRGEGELAVRAALRGETMT